MEQRIKGTTGLMMLIGSPVGHSGSPDMYKDVYKRQVETEKIQSAFLT